MVVAEVMRMEEDRYKIKAVSQGQGHSLSSEPSPVVWERRMLLTLQCPQRKPPAHFIRLQDRAFTGALQMAPRPGPEKASRSAGGVSTG